jgi:hypothetical protein
MQLVRNHNGPFFATIGKASEQHISTLRFAGGGGPIKAQKGTQAVVGRAVNPASSKTSPAEPAPAPPALF